MSGGTGKGLHINADMLLLFKPSGWWSMGRMWWSLGVLDPYAECAYHLGPPRRCGAGGAARVLADRHVDAKGKLIRTLSSRYAPVYSVRQTIRRRLK